MLPSVLGVMSLFSGVFRNRLYLLVGGRRFNMLIYVLPMASTSQAAST